MKRLNTQLSESTKQNSLKSPKLLSKRITKYYKAFGTSEINSLLSALYLDSFTVFHVFLLLNTIPGVIEQNKHKQVMTVKESVSKCVVLDGLLICSSQSGLSYASLKGKSGHMELVPVVGISPDTLIQRGTRVQVKIISTVLVLLC